MPDDDYGVVLDPARYDHLDWKGQVAARRKEIRERQEHQREGAWVKFMKSVKRLRWR